MTDRNGASARTRGGCEDPSGHTAYLMMAELDHRVANNLSCAIATLEITRLRSTDETIIKHLSRSIASLRGFAAVQRVLSRPRQSEDVDFADLLERLCGAIAEFRLVPAGFLISLDADRVSLPSHTAWLLATAASELITNAAKHAHAPGGGRIRVQLKRTDRNIILRVSDSGAGSKPVNAPQAFSSGTGAGLVDAIIACASGSVTRKVTPSGMQVTVRCRTGPDRQQGSLQGLAAPS